MSKIKKIEAREVLDSRGNPTVEACVITNHCKARAIVPSGASTGIHEALELRDKAKRYGGKGVQKAVNNIKLISKKLKGKDPTNQENIDYTMIDFDNTENKSKLGANAILAVSLAVCKAGAFQEQIPLYQHIKNISGTNRISLPIPQLNIINSGEHAGVKNDIQEHMILPTGFKTFKESLRAGTEIYHTLKKILKKKYKAQATLLGDEGGFAPKISSLEKRLDLMLRAIKEAGYSNKVKLGLDCAASEFYNPTKDKYKIKSKSFSKEKLVDFYKTLVKKYPIITIEDGMSEDDWEGWALLNNEIGNKIQLVGDDLLVTNISRINKAIDKDACNSLLLKVNQIGTVSESIKAASQAKSHDWTVVVSHRSGETEDSFIADLVVGLSASQSKFGAPARSERTAKYNQLLRIEEESNAKLSKI